MTGTTGRQQTGDSPASQWEDRQQDPRARGDRSQSKADTADRGVSDIVGFVLTVSIILIGVGVVGTVGVDQIERFQGTQNVENAQRAITVLAGNMDQLQESRAVALTSELAVQNGRLAVGAGGGPSELTVSVSQDSGSDIDISNVPMRTVHYRTEDTRVVYEGGAVILDNPEGESIPLRRPAFICSSDRAMVSFVTLHSGDAGQGYGGATAAVTTRLNESLIHYPRSRSGGGSVNESEGVEVTIDSAHGEAWGSFLEDSGWTNTGGSTYECDLSGSTTPTPVFVRQTVVDVDLDR